MYGLMPPLKKITHRQTLPTTADSGIGARVALVLECGHIVTMKKSQEPKLKTRCVDCQKEKDND